jgi:hypothetical protein
MRTRKIGRTILLVFLFLLACIGTKAQSGCPDPTASLPWQAGRTVHVDLSALPGDMQSAAAEAVSRANANGSVEFVAGGGDDLTLQTASYLHLPGGTCNAQDRSGCVIAGYDVSNRDASGFITKANAYITPNFIAPGANVNILDPAEPNYFEALVGLFLHEITHTLGLQDVPIPNPGGSDPCGGISRGNSVMNAYCGVNDRGWDLQGGARATYLTNCDNQGIGSWYSGTPDTDDYLISSGGGEDCYENWWVTIWETWNGDQWVYSGISWDEYNYTWCEPTPNY